MKSNFSFVPSFKSIRPILSLCLVILASVGHSQILTIPDTGWRLWPDTTAVWQADSLYLPEDIDLARLPVQAPSEGWQSLNPDQGIQVTLPATVEQFYWGQFGLRPYQDAYFFEKEDPQVKNGNYLGVSWWWREIEIPKSWRSRRVTLYVRGARLRAEVYWNQQLVGYHLINETCFTCDLSRAIRAGEKNLLAIRITNPGGRLDWVDTQLMNWGKYQFHASHGFGGLDRGLYLVAHDMVYLNDVWVLNTPEARTIIAHAEIQNMDITPAQGIVHFEILDPESRISMRCQKPWHLSGNATAVIAESISLATAQLWQPDQPTLYRLWVRLEGQSGVGRDQRERSFGFRWFAAEGIGQNAVLRLNDQRLRLISAISWGFWGLNGLWPTPDLAEKEVQAAKALGLNCLQFHRNTGKTEVLNAQNRLGLLRYMEPGGGQIALGEQFSLYADSPQSPPDLSGQNGEAHTFAEKYQEEKIIRMVRDQRSHPSLLMYCIQNEINPDLNNPRIFHLLRRIHAEDPSRIVLLKSGIPPINQAWTQPYDDSVYCDRGDGFSGWWDQHTVGGPGVWQDALYKNPRDFTHRSDNQREIVCWGEMLGAAVPDNHVLWLRQMESVAGKSYDWQDHAEILQAYDQFLDRWQFRSAFPTTEQLFQAIGSKSYDFWGRIIETARLSEANDFLVISGWESTAIENHSGLVDNLRNFKSDPALLRTRLAAVRPVIKPRSLVLEPGARDTLDLFFLNESQQAVGKTGQLSLTDPIDTETRLGTFALPAWHKDQFVYPVAEKVLTPPLGREGRYRLQFSLAEAPEIFSQDTLLVVAPWGPEPVSARVGVLVHEPEFIRMLSQMPGLKVESYRSEGHYDLVLASMRLLYGWRSEVDSTRDIANTEDDRLFHTESWGDARNLEYTFTNLPKGPARVTLFFAEITLSGPGERVFDVAINDQTVLDDFDISASAGGINIAIEREFTVAAPAGVVKITIPERKVNYAKFSAIKVEAGDTVIAINCGGAPYRDKTGLIWQKYAVPSNLSDALLAQVRDGLPLLLLPDGPEAADNYGQRLGEAGAFRYLGHVGSVRAAWMGSWLFVRAHPVFDGLPVNCALTSYYQAPVSGADGLLLDGENVTVFVGYGRDHDRNIGAASFSVRLGDGPILFHSLPGLVTGVQMPGKGLHPVLQKRLLANSIRYLLKAK